MCGGVPFFFVATCNLKMPIESVDESAEERVAKRSCVRDNDTLERLRPLAGQHTAQVKRIYAIDHRAQAVIAVPSGVFAAKVYVHELPFVVADSDGLTQDMGLSVLHSAVKLSEVQGICTRIIMACGRSGVGSIIYNAQHHRWDVTRDAFQPRIRVCVYLSAMTEMGALMAALLFRELSACTTPKDMLRVKAAWIGMPRELRRWQLLPTEPDAIAQPTHVPALFLPYVTSALMCHAQVLDQPVRIGLLRETNRTHLAISRPTLRMEGQSMSFCYPRKGHEALQKVTLPYSRTQLDIQVLAAAALLSTTVTLSEIVAALDEWKIMRVGLVNPIEQPQFAFPHVCAGDRHTREAMTKTWLVAPDVRLLPCVEAGLHDVVVEFANGTACAVQLKGSGLHAYGTTNKVHAIFRSLHTLCLCGAKCFQNWARGRRPRTSAHKSSWSRSIDTLEVGGCVGIKFLMRVALKHQSNGRPLVIRPARVGRRGPRARHVWSTTARPLGRAGAHVARSERCDPAAARRAC